MRFSTTKNVDTIEATALTTHRTSDGKNHADVVSNTAAITGGKGPGQDRVEQAVVVDATLNAFVFPIAGTILGVSAKLGTGCAAGQDVAVDVLIAGTSCLTAPIDLVAGTGTNVLVGTIDAAHDDWTANQLVTVTVNETNAGGPTAAALTVFIAYRLV